MFLALVTKALGYSDDILIWMYPGKTFCKAHHSRILQALQQRTKHMVSCITSDFVACNYVIWMICIVCHTSIQCISCHSLQFEKCRKVLQDMSHSYCTLSGSFLNAYVVSLGSMASQGNCKSTFCRVTDGDELNRYFDQAVNGSRYMLSHNLWQILHRAKSYLDKLKLAIKKSCFHSNISELFD